MNRAAIFVLGLVLVCLSAWTSACSSNPTPHPANDATGVPLSDATGDTSGPAPGHDTSSDSGQFSDLVSTPDGVAGDSSADVPADGEVGADTGIDGGPEVDAGACSAANMPCCCDFDVVAEAVCGGGAWTCPLGFAPYFGLECTRDCGPCFYAPACAEADAGSGPD